MRKTELTFDLINILKEIVDKFQPELLKQVVNTLNSRESRLLNAVFRDYYYQGEGRWYDPYHILVSTNFAVKCKEVPEQVSSLIVPAIILHDIGYFALADKESWDAPQSRIIHMQEGTALAAKILVEVGGYSAKDIGIIVGMIATHDNPYLGILITDLDRLALRDADRMWVMHFLSFYKDWISKRKKQESFSLTDLYELQMNSFYEKEVPYTCLAGCWRDRQFAIRHQEIKKDIIKNETIFWNYAEEHLRTELKAGRA